MLLFVYKYFLMLCISLRLVGLNIYFYNIFFLTIKMVQKGYIEMMGFFYCEIVLKVRQTNLFYTTVVITIL